MKKQTKWVTGLTGAVVFVAAILLSSCQAPEQVGGWLQDIVGGSGAQENSPLVASGMIHADEIRIASETGGRIVSIQAERGVEVQAGTELVILDVTPVLSMLDEAEIAVAAARADLTAIKASPRAEEVAALRAALSLAEAQRDGALSALENALEALQNPQELDAQIVGARTRVNLAEQGVFLAEAELAQIDLLRDLKEKGTDARDIADLQVKAAEEKLAAAKVDQETAQTLLNWLWAIRNEPLGLVAQAHATEGQYRIAEKGVAVAQARLDDLLAGPTQEKIAVAEANVRLAQAQVDAIEVQIDRFKLTSPMDGVVLNQPLRAGELAAPAATILTVADLSRVTVQVYVPETRVGEVQLGQEVLVTVDSFPGRAFSGQVTRIGDEPEFTPRNVATKEERVNTYYAVEISLPNDEGLLKPGMPADASF